MRVDSILARAQRHRYRGEIRFEDLLPVAKYERDICRNCVAQRLPVLSWLPRYRIPWLLQDALAGITVGLTAVPQGIAYGVVAGLNPEVNIKTDRINYASTRQNTHTHTHTEMLNFK